MLQALIAYLFKISFTYPMVNFPLRITIQYLICGEMEASTLQLFWQTFVPFVTATAVACVVSDVAVVWGFIGALTRTIVFYFYPALLMLRSSKVGRLTTVECTLCWSLVGLAVVTTVFGVIGCIRNVL